MEKTERITNKDRFLEIAEIVGAADREDLVEFCNEQVERLEAKAAKAKERAAKLRAEGDELKDTVFGILSEDSFKGIAEIVAEIGQEDITPAKVTARLTKLGKEGVIEKQEITIPAGEGKTRKANGYRKIAN